MSDTVHNIVPDSSVMYISTVVLSQYFSSHPDVFLFFPPATMLILYALYIIIPFPMQP